MAYLATGRSIVQQAASNRGDDITAVSFKFWQDLLNLPYSDLQAALYVRQGGRRPN